MATQLKVLAGTVMASTNTPCAQRLSLFTLRVTMHVSVHRSPLLSAAAVLHRRGIDVTEASLVQRSEQLCVFSATFRAGADQARTLRRTFENLVESTDVVLTAGSDGPPEADHTTGFQPSAAPTARRP